MDVQGLIGSGSTKSYDARLQDGAMIVALPGILLLVVAIWLAPDGPWILPGTAAATLIALSVAVWARAGLRKFEDHRHLAAMKDMLALDRSPAFLTDSHGDILWRNVEAELGYGAGPGGRIAPLIAGVVAEPGKLLSGMQARASVYGHARESRSIGERNLHISVISGRRGVFSWRIEDIQRERPEKLNALPVPVAEVNDADSVTTANTALRELLGKRPNSLSDFLSQLPADAGDVASVTTEAGELPMRVHWTREKDRRMVCLIPLRGETQDDGDLFETLPVPLLKLNVAGEIVLANRSARALLDDPIEPGRQLSELVSGLGRSVTDWLQDACEGRGLNRSEFLQVTKQTKDVFVQVTLKRLPEDDDAALVAVLNDATELKTLEAQFVQSQKMQAIGQLAGGVAHDFNNLLTAISGHCDLLLLRHDQGDPEYGDLVQIHQNTNRAASLVGQLLAFSRKQTLQPEVVDLRESLSELTHLLNRLVGERITLSLEHERGVAPIRADKRQLEQVIMNLVVNARDAMPDGGEIAITTETQTLDREIKRNRAAIPPGTYSVVKVVDHGCGISPDKIGKVFEPFYTTKRTGEGTGLGLSTAYGIVKQTGGFIFVESTIGEGSTFTLYFPAHSVREPLAELPEPVAAEESATTGEGVVLLVEDEAPVRAFASRALRLRGYTVLEAESAEQALETLTDDDLAVDVFVTDVVMPGMDGPTWVQEALKTRPETRVVFVSGYAEDALADHKSKIPNSVFLPKPFSLNDLTRTVQAQFNSRLH